MKQRILVITATLGNRETLSRTIDSVRTVGGDDVRHVIVCPERCIDSIKEKFDNIECLAERTDKRGIYAALNHGFQIFGHEHEYLTFINDDDYWLPNYRRLIDAMFNDEKLDMVYGRVRYVDAFNRKNGEQTCGPFFRKFCSLLTSDVVLLTQQSTLIKSSLYFKIGGFDESFKLVADTKFWALASQIPDLRFRYINRECAAYMIQEGQLSSDHTTQYMEHTCLLEEIGVGKTSGRLVKIAFRLYNTPIYLRRLFCFKKMSQCTPLKLLIMIMPWKIKRLLLNRIFDYQIHPKARIGLSYIYPKMLIMEEGATIGHLNVAIHLALIHMERECTICQRNWITGFPMEDKSNFQDFPERRPYLIMKKDSAITKEHLIDCTDTVTIGELTSIGGYGTQILSHSTSLQYNKQSCEPITIGHHCFVGTRSIILPGSILPDQSVLGAGAVLKKKFSEKLSLYGGVPAKFIKNVDECYEFFHRTYRPK